MQKLLQLSYRLENNAQAGPLSVYSSVHEQRLLNVPIVKPLFIAVLEGRKTLGKDESVICPLGNFIFLSNSSRLDMRNIPEDSTYRALVLEFEFEDFADLSPAPEVSEAHFQGPLDSLLQEHLEQFALWATQAPADLWPLRRRELLHVLDHLGYPQVRSVMQPTSLSHRIHLLITKDLSHDWNASALGHKLAMSEATLHRHLRAEGTQLQALKDQARLGQALHALQSSKAPISLIAEQCGYRSQSRFTEKFKQNFGLTPTELRKTRLRE